MNIIAYGPPSSDKPYIPKMVILEDGSKKFEIEVSEAHHGGQQFAFLDDGSFGEVKDPETEVLDAPRHIPDGHWFAVLDDGSFEFFEAAKREEWAAKKASEVVLSARVPKADPLATLSSLRAAAALVNVPFSDLLAAIQLFGEKTKSSGSLYEIFILMRAKGGVL